MRWVIAAFALVTVMACSMIKGAVYHTIKPAEQSEPDIMGNIPPAELEQDPGFAEVPEHGGWMIGMHFSIDLTDQQDAYFLGGFIGLLRQNGQSTDGKVAIFLYEGKTESVSVTADYVSNVVEFWSTKDRETYTKRTFEGDPDMILSYLSDGTCGNPKVENGKIMDEVKPKLGKKDQL